MRKVHARAAVASAAFSAVLAPLALASCVKEPSLEELATQTVVVTQVAPGVDFTSFHTYAMSESIDIVTELDGGDGGSSTAQVDPSLAVPTLEAIAAQMTSRGYRRVSRTDKPDLGVAVNAVVRVNAAIPYGAWWGYGAATGGYWGYGGVPFASGVSSTGVALWKSGALVIELYDLRAARAATAGPITVQSAPAATAPDAGSTPTITIVWAAFIYGVIGGLASKVQQPPIAGIEQAFAQSPYLRTSP